ncbi:MAG: V-type ATP synthase subunit F [Anaerolineaceae bacterium]
MIKLVVITTFSMANGYRLAGIDARGVADEKAAEDLVRDYIENSESVLLAVDDELFAKIDRKLIKSLYDCKHIALVTIPGKSEKPSTRVNQEHLYDMIYHATGRRIHFKGENNGSNK